MIHLFLFLLAAPGVFFTLALGTAMAAIFLCYIGLALSERKWGTAVQAYCWFGVFASAIVVAVNALVTYREQLIPTILQ